MPISPPMAAYLKSIRGKPEAREAAELIGYASPSATGGKPRRGYAPPYWMKTVRSIDPTYKTGYGINGDFLNKDDYKKLPANALFIIKERDSENIVLLCKKHGTKGKLHLASGKELEFEDTDQWGVFESFEKLIQHLDDLGTSHATSEKGDPNFGKKKSA